MHKAEFYCRCLTLTYLKIDLHRDFKWTKITFTLSSGAFSHYRIVAKNTYKLNNSWFDPQTVRKGEGGRGKRWPAAPFVSFLPHLHKDADEDEPKDSNPPNCQRLRIPKCSKDLRDLNGRSITGSREQQNQTITSYSSKSGNHLGMRLNPPLSGNTIKHILNIQDGCNCPSWTKMHSWTQAFLVLEKPWKCKS